MRFSSLFTLFPWALFATVSLAQNITDNGIGSTPAQRHYVSAKQAASIVNAAHSAAESLGAAENIAVVDLSGMLVAFLRMDNSFLGGIDLAMKKAKSIVLFNGYNTTALYDASLPDGGLFETNGGLVFFPGGLPLYKNGFLIGAVGASGGAVAQDVATAQAGVDWLNAS
ncbi:hypothetical protein MBLNU459_g7682t2 [Dothideomycetes sp. NU459]